ncbi:TetR/AcrR family transcriptional regulator [Desulfopila sp. IMCC35008]|uniref:TetR/AcrR family transcriptional regulator n=1 Tax=Desulfopila sp. IMCC35008 TaxID=2653858 RepID=UPI0013D3F008|nr:TetR/AcrR family transcriptional regulator [Desulfopila sp. IMCC35008]
MSGTREEKKRKTKKAILSAAVELFGKYGFEKTSIAQLARTAGVGKGTVYSYFKTKQDILQAFCDDELEFIHERLTSESDTSKNILDQMVTIFLAEFTYVTRNPEFGRIYMQESVFPRKQLLTSHNESENRYFEMIFPVIKNAQDRGELREDLELLHICGHFFALYLLVLHSWYTDLLKTEEAEEALRTLFTQIIHGLQPLSKTPTETRHPHEL